MKWNKVGRIIKPEDFDFDWMSSHAQNPFAEHVRDDLFKIHFASRDKLNRSRGGSVLIDIKNPSNILDITKNPTLELGDRGCFDDCGAMPSCIVDFDNKKYLYYLGWTQAKTVPFLFFIGLAISTDNGKTYKKYSKAPIFGRSHFDPYLTAMPWIIREEGIWKMWYVSCTGWQEESIDKPNSKNEHFYHIRYASSVDGINWNSDGTVCIDFRDQEYAIARPVVYKEQGVYKMWYCYRGGNDTYRAGYAESTDGIKWNRMDDKVGIDVSKDDWDAGMICYPCVFEHKNHKYMLYNSGNNYGENGTGLAILES